MLKKQEMPQNLNCLNCETAYSGWFCPQCGQKSKTKRLKVLTVLHDFYEALSDSNQGVLRNIIDLSENPGQMIQDYLKGKRRRYLSAGKYTLLMIVLFTINISYLETHFGFFEGLTAVVDTFSVTQVGGDIHLTDKKMQEKLIKDHPDARVITDPKPDSYGVINVPDENKVMVKFDFLGKHIDKKASKAEFFEFLKILIPKYHQSLFNSLKFFIILWVPAFSLVSFWYFRKQKLNFAEHITINSFIYAQLLLITMVMSIFVWVLPAYNGTTFLTTMVITTFYFFYAYLQIFSKGPRRLLKTTMVIFTGSATYSALLCAIVIAQIAYVAVLNIDKL